MKFKEEGRKKQEVDHSLLHMTMLCPDEVHSEEELYIREPRSSSYEKNASDCVEDISAQ